MRASTVVAPLFALAGIVGGAEAVPVPSPELAEAQLRAINHRFVEAFVAESAGVSSPKPPNLARIVEINRGPFVPTAPPPPELPAPPDGAQLLDVRPVDAHLAGHRPGAVNVPVSGSSFSTKAAFVLDAAAPVAESRLQGETHG